jgi:hypothetical protein
MLDSSNTASGACADIAYRSAANERFLDKNGFVNQHPSQEAERLKAPRIDI